MRIRLMKKTEFQHDFLNCLSDLGAIVTELREMKEAISDIRDSLTYMEEYIQLKREKLEEE